MLYGGQAVRVKETEGQLPELNRHIGSSKSVFPYTDIQISTPTDPDP